METIYFARLSFYILISLSLNWISCICQKDLRVYSLCSEAATKGVLRNSQENSCERVFIKKDTLAQVLSSEFCEISKNTFFYRTPLNECFYLLFVQMIRKRQGHEYDYSDYC